MKTRYGEVIQFLESLQIMPKTLPGLRKIKKALEQTEWYERIDPEKIVVVAGTNGKGSTCASLEALLLSANQQVGFYSSPHLVSTTERMRIAGASISEENFIQLFEQCENLIRTCELSHFEALTLMAGHYFFSSDWNLALDYVILEVGLGGTFDATNAFPHRFSVITPLGLDHTNILGKTLLEVAQNKFGIVHRQNRVIFQKLDLTLLALKNEVLQRTDSRGQEVDSAVFQKGVLSTEWGETHLSLPGLRGAQNAMTALTTFAALGFDPALHLKALQQVRWPGRMQKLAWPGLACDLYLSGDHNPQGIQSLIAILQVMRWRALHIVIGIGLDKDADEMLAELVRLIHAKLYLTVTPFKGRSLQEYSKDYRDLAVMQSESPIEILQEISKTAEADDLVVVTGSLYLVGEVLRHRGADVGF